MADLKSRPESAEFVKALRVAFESMQNPRLIARVAAKVYMEGQRLAAVPITELERALELLDSQSRAVASLAGLSPGTAARFVTTGRAEALLPAQAFFDRYPGAGMYFVDLQFATNDHGVMTHMFQDLVLNEAFAEAGIAFDARSFRMKLADTGGVPGKVYYLDNQQVSFGTKAFAEVFDSNARWTTHRPEDLAPLLKQFLKQLK